MSASMTRRGGTGGRHAAPLGLSLLIHAGVLAAGLLAVQTLPPAAPWQAVEVTLAIEAPAAPMVAEARPELATEAVEAPAEPPPPVVAEPAPAVPVPDVAAMIPAPEPLPPPEIVVERAEPLPPPPVARPAPPPRAPGAVRPAAPRPARAGPPQPAAAPVAAPVPTPAAPPADEGPLLITAPRFRSPPAPPVYPRTAREMGQEGEVLIRARLDLAGNPEEVLLARSSGFDMLDRAAMAAVWRWPFEPGRRGGTAVVAWVQIPVRFTLR